MSTRASARTPVAPVLRLGPILAVAMMLSACATSGATSARVEVEGETGFTITEPVAVGDDVRSDFESALRRLERGEHDRGIDLLLQVTEAAPDLAAAHIDLGIAYGRADELEKAEASFERALALNPRHPVAHNELGIVYRRTGRFGEARKSYERALSIYPGFHFARRNLAILCDVYLADAECALEHYERYREAVPDDEAAAVWIADLRNRTRR